MGHIQRRCRTCRRSVPEGERSCPACGEREIAYVARWLDPDGVERSESFPRRAPAQRKLVGLEDAKLRGGYIDPTAARQRLEDYAAGWYERVKPSLKPKTRASYESLLRSRILPTFGRRELGALRPSDVEGWVNEMSAAGLSASRIRQAVVVLGRILSAAVRDEIIARNVARGTQLPPLPTAEAAYFDPKQVERLACAHPAPFDLYVRLLGTVGLRFGEGAALRRRSVDPMRRRLIVSDSLAEIGGELTFGTTKTHAARIVPLPKSLSDALATHLETRVGAEPDALVFMASKGGPLRYSNFKTYFWQPALVKAKLPPIGVHVLRHSAAAAMIHAGCTPKQVQKILGHRDPGFTMRVYAHLFEADLDDAAKRLEAVVRPPKTGRTRDRNGTRARRTHLTAL